MLAITMHFQKAVSVALTVFAVCICCLLLYDYRISGKFAHLSVESPTNLQNLDDPHKCRALTTIGSWSRDFSNLEDLDRSEWRPTGCMLHTYTSQDIDSCTRCKNILFIGDSITRQIYWATARKLNSTKAEDFNLSAHTHDNLRFDNECSTLEFLWDPYLNLTSTVDALQTVRDGASEAHSANDTGASFVLIGAGLWHARYLGDEYLRAFKSSIEHIMPQFQQNISQSRLNDRLPYIQCPRKGSMAFVPILQPLYESLDPNRTASLTPARIGSLNELLEIFQGRVLFDVLWSFNQMLAGHMAAYEVTGIHVVEKIASVQADVLLNLHCNARASYHYPFNKTCCAPSPPFNIVQICLCSLAFTVLGRVLISIVAEPSSGQVSPRALRILHCSRPVEAGAIMSLVLVYCFAADRTLFLGTVSKIVNQSRFLMLTGSVLAVGLLTWKSATHISHGSEKVQSMSLPDYPFLSRQQTEEWKGWMQIIILCYHYFGMSKVLWAYQFIRLLVASYLFMTGYGHTLYYLRTNNFSIRRVSNVLLRLNLLSCALPYFMRTDYDFYYFPALSSFWFLVVHLTLAGWTSETSLRIRIVQIVVSAAVVRTIITWPGILEAFFSALHNTCRMNVNVREFRFRVSLDMYVVFFGMVFAVIYHKLSNLPSGCWEDCRPRLSLRQQIFRSLSSLLAMAVLVSYVIFCGQFADKYSYNKWHPLTSPLPVLAFVVLRNATPWLRTCHVQIFAWIGRCSLETYILQYHIWLAADTKGLLHLPFFDKLSLKNVRIFGNLKEGLEFTIITAYFLWASWCAGRATAVLSAWIVDPPETQLLHRRRFVGVSIDLHHRSRLLLARHFVNRGQVGLLFRLLILLGCLVGLNWLWTEPEFY